MLKCGQVRIDHLLPRLLDVREGGLSPPPCFRVTTVPASCCAGPTPISPGATRAASIAASSDKVQALRLSRISMIELRSAGE